MTASSMMDNASLESLVAQVVDEFMGRQKKGERPDASEYAARYPQAAAVLRDVLAALNVDGLSGGGLSAVYEAEQISLGPRVAIKVRPIVATIPPLGDCDRIAAFINASIDALAAETLQHPVTKPPKLILNSEADLICDFGLAMDTDVYSPGAVDPDFVVTHDGVVLCKKEQDVA